MKFSNVRLLVKDFKKCFKFYAEQVGLEVMWGDEDNCYANFKVADNIEGFAIFVSDYMAPVVGNADTEQPVGYRDKSMVCFEVANVDESYAELKTRGIEFINEPVGMPDWGMRVVHFRDPEGNLIELLSLLAE